MAIPPRGADAAFDARITTPLASQAIIGHTAIGRNSIEGNYIVDPMNLGNSELWIRDTTLFDSKMPPIGKNIIDLEYVHLLKSWIESIGPTIVNINTPVCLGDSYQLPNQVVLDSITENVTDTTLLFDQFGLDSLVIINLLVKSGYHLDTVIALCEGSSFEFPNGDFVNDISESMNHTSSLLTSSGCDSLINTFIDIQACTLGTRKKSAKLFPNPVNNTITIEVLRWQINWRSFQ